jgi:glyoxylase-like metal-dependent hydrolase (beta-lactamase superfamily II)
MSKLIKTYFAGSSSNGNTAILYFDDFIFQVDAGCAWKTFKDIPVDYTFITHRHSDHTHNIRKALNLLDTDDCKYIVSKHFKLNIFDVPHSVPNQGFILDCGKDKIA